MPISAAKRRNPSRDAQMFGGPHVHLGGASDAGSRRDAALRADFSSRQAYIADLVARDRALRNGDGSGSARGSTGVLPAYGDAYRPARRRDAWEQQSRSHSTLASLGLLAAERGASSAAQTTHPSSSARVGRPPAAAAAAAAQPAAVAVAPAAAEAAAAAAAAPRPGAKVLHFGTPPPTRSESVARVRQQQAAAVAAADQQQQQHAPRPRGSSVVNRDVREAAREAVRQRQAGDGGAWPTGKYRRDMASDGAARVMGLTAAAGVASSSSSSSAAAEQSPARVAYLKGQRRPAERDAAGLPPTPREYSKRVFRDRSPSPFAPPEKRAQPAGGALSRRSTSVDAIGCESHDRERAHGLRPLPRPSNNHIAHVGRAPSPLRRGPSRSGTPSKTFNPILGC
eukprot:Rhum_TRINITY_DN13101_c1_g1::Rhum_TRINITY_DN13101_c1_g1_i1::g.57060::m.57060